MSEQIRYAVLRITPDDRRGEVVNIGLAVFLSDRLDVRLLPSLAKVRAVDPRVDLDGLFALPRALEAFVATVPTVEQRHALLAGFPGVNVSALGWFTLERATDYERHVDTLLRELVAPPAAERPRIAVPTRLETAVKRQFAQRQILGDALEDVRRHRVVHRYPIAPGENLYADFALKNGAWHLTETLDLRGSAETVRNTKFNLATRKAVTLHRAGQVLDGCTKLVVYAADEAALNIAQHHIALLSGFAERLYNWLDPTDAGNYLDRISDLAGRPGLG